LERQNNTPVLPQLFLKNIGNKTLLINNGIALKPVISKDRKYFANEERLVL
jgi:hypothetical protein